MGSMVWDHGGSEPFSGVIVRASDDTIVDSFKAWWNHGAKRDAFYESYRYEIAKAHFVEGWRDIENNRSDFKRRSMSHETGARSAYMTARFLGACWIRDERRKNV